jgi:acyl carrier protein
MGSDATVRAQLARRGLRALSPPQALEALSLALSGQEVHVVVADVDWTLFREGFEAWGSRPLLAEIGREPGTAGGVPEEPAGHPMLERLAALRPAEREGHLQEWLTSECAAVLGHPEGTQLDPYVGFFDLGMDSLMVVELKKRLERALGVRVSEAVTFDHPNIDVLAAKLLADVGLSPRHALAPTIAANDAKQASYSGSDEDALRLIMEKYEALS